MKKFFVCSIIFASVIFPSSALAQIGGSDKEIESVLQRQEAQKQRILEMQQAIKDREASRIAELKLKQEDLKERIASKTAETREKIMEKRKEFIRKYFEQMVRRIENALERQARIAERISSRLSKMKANGKNVSSLEAKLETAKIKQTEAKALLTDAKNKMETVLVSDKPMEAFKNVKSIIKNIVVKVKEVHALYVEIITEMKGMSDNTKVKPTGTSSSVNVTTTDSNVSVHIESNVNSSVKTVVTIVP